LLGLGLRLLSLGLLVVSLVLSPVRVSAAPPDDPHAQLRRGVALQREASWTASIASLERARASGALSGGERAECAFYLAAAYLAIGSEAAARRELALVLEIQPGFEPPPYTSPKVASLLGEVARQRATAPTLEARPPRPARGNGLPDGTLELGFEARRARSPIFGVVRYRMRGERAFREAPLVQREVRADAPLGLYAEVRPDRSGVLEYHAEALCPTGALTAGTAERPIELPVPEGPRSASSKARGPSPWVWSAIPIGVVLGAGIGLGLFYGLRSADR